MHTLYFIFALLVALPCYLLPQDAHAGEITPQLKTLLKTTPDNEKIAVIVQLKEQLNRKQYKRLKKKLRRLQLLKQLKAKAAADQVSLKSYLLGTGSKKMRTLWIINGLAVEAKPAVIKKLAKRPEVKEVRLDQAILLAYDASSASAPSQWNISMLGADLLWDQGYLGQGVVVASMDSGVDYLHTQLQANWRGGNNSWFDPHNQHSLPYDANGHGTQTMGIMAGQNTGGTTLGVAPSAQWIAAKIFDDAGSAHYSDIHASFQWLLDPDGNPNTDDLPDIVNNSWGYPETVDTCVSEFQTDIQTLRDLDVNVVFSAGNQGAGPSSVSPANNPGVFSVGAVDENMMVTSFSSRGPSACGQGGVYPTAVAPGYLINTTDLTFGGIFSDSTMLATGTSFAAPHASGIMALLLSVDPNLTPDELEMAITASAADLGLTGDDNVYGSGLINAASAYNALFSAGECTDADGDGFFIDPSCGEPVDCNDNNGGIYPGAIEIGFDGIDQDCNSLDLTITVTKALYRTAKDKLIIFATSDQGSNGALEVTIPGIGVKTLTWKATKQRWQKTITRASTKGFQPETSPALTVFGPEGSVDKSIVIKK